VALASESGSHGRDNPSPSVSTGAGVDDRGGLRNGSDDPAGHDANDDKGGQRAAGVSDDPAGHDANDDKGGQRASGSSAGKGGNRH
jgi:hypothetical protein